MLQIVECPRDAMQGLHEFIPTAQKVRYLNQLLRCGFHTIDFGSFVSPKAIPQLADTPQVLQALDLEGSTSELLAIVANARGAADACTHEPIRYIGYPFSISETFQKRNTNAGIDESLLRVDEIHTLCEKHGKEMVLYISMAFGNPYGDLWHPDIAIHWAEKLYRSFGTRILALSDTVGSSTPAGIAQLFTALIPELPGVTFGAHLHTTPDKWRQKAEAAWISGCRRFDGALRGYGGCPMAADHLTGNMPTEKLLTYVEEVHGSSGIDPTALSEALRMSTDIFG